MKPYNNPLATASMYGVYTEIGILNHVGIMFPGNRGTGTAMDAEVKRRKKTTKIAAAFMLLFNLAATVLLLDKAMQQLRAS